MITFGWRVKNSNSLFWEKIFKVKYYILYNSGTTKHIGEFSIDDCEPTASLPFLDFGKKQSKSIL